MVRNSAKAIIIENGRLLCTKNEDQWGIFYLLPGGGQRDFEPLSTTLERECLEEINSKVTTGDIRFIREYIGRNHEFKAFDREIHQVEYMFECQLKDKVSPDNGQIPDDGQIGVEWLNLSELDSYRIYPSILKRIIGDDGRLKGPVYLGDAN